MAGGCKTLKACVESTEKDSIIKIVPLFARHFDFILLDSEATGLARLHASDSSSRCLPYHRFLVCHSDWSKLAPAQWMAACIGHPTTRFYNSNLFDKHIERFPVLCWLALLRFLILTPLRLMFIFQAKIIGHYAPRLAMWMDVNGAMLQCWFCCAWWNGLRCHHVSQQIQHLDDIGWQSHIDYLTFSHRRQVINEIRYGGATYVSTGRGLPTDRRPFIGEAVPGKLLNCTICTMPTLPTPPVLWTAKFEDFEAISRHFKTFKIMHCCDSTNALIICMILHFPWRRGRFQLKKLGGLYLDYASIAYYVSCQSTVAVDTANTPLVERLESQKAVHSNSGNWGRRDASCGSRADLFGRRCIRCWSLPQRRVVGFHLSLPDCGFVAVGTIHLQPISAPSAATDASTSIIYLIYQSYLIISYMKIYVYIIVSCMDLHGFPRPLDPLHPIATAANRHSRFVWKHFCEETLPDIHIHSQD